MTAPSDPVKPPRNLAFIESRRAGSDARMLALLDEILSRPDAWQEWPDAEDVRRTILGFKYWVDEPGTDSVRYWSESHALCYSACAYLAGHAFPAPRS